MKNGYEAVISIFILPLHTADIFKACPAIGSKLLAYIRLPLQFVLIWWAWRIFSSTS